MGRSINNSSTDPNGAPRSLVEAASAYLDRSGLHKVTERSEGDEQSQGSKSNGLEPPRRVIVGEDKDGVALITSPSSPSPGRAAAQTPEKPERIVEEVRQSVPEATESGSLADALLLAEKGIITLTRKKSSSQDTNGQVQATAPKEQPQQTPADKTPPEKAFEVDDDEVIDELGVIGEAEAKLLDKISEKIGEWESMTTTDYRLLEDDSSLIKIKVAENGEDTSEVTSYLVLQKKDGDLLVFGGKHAKEVDGETRENAFKTINSAEQFEQESRKVETEIGDASDFEIDVQPSEIDVATLNEIELYRQICDGMEKAANEKGQEDRAAKARDLRTSLTNLLENKLMDTKAPDKIFGQIRELFENTESASSPDVTGSDSSPDVADDEEFKVVEEIEDLE